MTVRDVETAKGFFGPAGIGLALQAATEDWALFMAGKALVIRLLLSAKLLCLTRHLLPLARDTAQFCAAPGVSLHVRQTYSEAELSAGYNPLLSFEVKNLTELVPSLLQMGASLDGAIAHEPMHSVASIRSPSAVGGVMLTLVEPNQAAADTPLR